MYMDLVDTVQNIEMNKSVWISSKLCGFFFKGIH